MFQCRFRSVRYAAWHVFASFFLLLACGTSALAAEPLDLVATLQYALTHNPRVMSMRATLANAQADLVKARTAEFPSITGMLQNVSSKSSHLEGNFAQYGLTPASMYSQNTAQIASQFTLYNGSLNQIEAQQARRRFQRAQADLEREQRTLAGDVTGAFFALVGKEQNIQLAEHDLAYHTQLLDSARTQEHVGRVAGVDVLRAQVDATRSESAVITARADAVNARESLAAQIGASLETLFALPTILPEPPLPATPLKSLLDIARTCRPEIVAAGADLRVAMLSASMIDADLRPQVTLSGSFGSQITPTQFGLQQSQIDAQNAFANAQYQFEQQQNPGITWPPPILFPSVQRAAPGFWQVQVQSTWSLPFSSIWQRRATHQAARAEIGAQMSALDAAQTNVEFDVRSALRSAQTSSANLSYAKANVSLADESARIAQLQYLHGLMSLTDVTATEQTDLSAQTDLIDARDKYLVSFIKLRLALADTPIALAVHL